MTDVPSWWSVTALLLTDGLEMCCLYPFYAPHSLSRRAPEITSVLWYFYLYEIISHCSVQGSLWNWNILGHEADLFLSLNSHVVMLSIACPLRYPLKAIQFILDSSLMPFTSLLSYMMQLLHCLVLTHHLLHPFLTLLLCFRRLPSEPQVRACNPELLQATVLPSHHGLARYGLSPALTTARICFTDRIFFSCHSPP